MDHLFSCFGYERIIWGSDFPVLNLVSHYQEWYELCRDYVDQFGAGAHDAVFGENALAFYQK
jgi:L-fuconolactonase